MKRMNEDKLLAELYLDLKGPKKKRDNWINIAKKCKWFVDKYGSVEKAAAKLDISYELLRSITILLTLPREVQGFIKEGKILYDAAQRLYRIKDPTKQIEIAKMIVGLPSHKQREIIQHASKFQFDTKFPASGIEEYKKRVIAPETKTEKIYLAIIPLREEIYRQLGRYSSKSKISVEKLILKIVNAWIKKEG